MQKTLRLKRELLMLTQNPPFGITCWQEHDNIDQLKANILGGDGTPYAGGVFELDIFVSERYPFEPPKVQFVTPIYHPNIDTAGRICLDTLKMPPQGAWKPSLNIGSLLTTIQLLMSEPNPDDPLMSDIAMEYKFNRQVYARRAKEWTEKHAKSKTVARSGSSSGENPSLKLKLPSEQHLLNLPMSSSVKRNLPSSSCEKENYGKRTCN